MSLSFLPCSGLATAVPPNRLTAGQTADHLAALCARDVREAARVHAAVRLSEVDERCSVLAGDHGEMDFYSRDATPSTAARMRRYEAEAGPLAARACRLALERAALPAEAVTHLVTASCTGFSAPGFDLELLRKLGLSPAVARTHLGFMGCHGAFNALKVARAFVQADSSARVLVVCAELCSLHLQRSLHRDALVPNTLFADGAAALIVGGEPSGPDLFLGPLASHVFPDSAGAMTWTITDTGFAMTLAPEVPALIGAGLRPWLEGVLASAGIGLRDVAGWAIHPGGPKILDAAGKCLGLATDDLAASREILRTHGNMSSATILFVVEEWKRRHPGAQGVLVALAFGPGLTAEMALMRLGS
ncbi:MAG: type III polyketide synthase [Sumerlaeia bacterium]